MYCQSCESLESEIESFVTEKNGEIDGLGRAGDGASGASRSSKLRKRQDPFVATRPLSTAGLVAAKLRMALASTLFAWLLVLVAIPLGLTISGRWPVVFEEARGLTDFFGAPRAVVVALLSLLGLLATTWKQLVQGLSIGLEGLPLFTFARGTPARATDVP